MKKSRPRGADTQYHVNKEIATIYLRGQSFGRAIYQRAETCPMKIWA